MTETTNPFDEALQALEKKQPLAFRSGMRDRFLADIKNSIEFRNGSFRSKSGAVVESIETYLLGRLDNSHYLMQRPTNRYSPIFPVRNAETRQAHKKLSESVLRKAFEHLGLVFKPGTQKNIVEVLSKNFLPVDGPDGNLQWKMISDTEIGALPSRAGVSTEELVSGMGIGPFIDNQATRISKLAHRAALRQKASGMLPNGAKPTEIEKLVDELQAFESRSLRTNKILPSIDPATISSEFVKFWELQGSNRSQALASARIQTEALNNPEPVAREISKVEIPETTTPHKF